VQPTYEDLEIVYAALKIECSRYKASHEALMDALIVDGIYRSEHELNPRRAIHDLCCWEQAVALDPAVSKEAQDLRDTYKPKDPNDSTNPPLGEH
jgi:hypothetical protein